MHVIVAGTGTEVGKTIAAAILSRMLRADYWKPVSCASEEECDRRVVEGLLSDTDSTCHREAYSLPYPLSPHAAARRAGVTLKASLLQIPVNTKRLVIELVGGVLCPFNDDTTLVDILKHWDCQWVVVSKNELGSINHTLLTAEALQARDISPLGIIFNGEETPESEAFIRRHTGLPCIGRIDQETTITSETIKRYSALWSTIEPWKTLNH